MSQWLQYLLLAFASAYWVISLAMSEASRRLRSTIVRAETSGAENRPGTGSYFHLQLKFRINPGAPMGMAISLISIVIVGFFIVYVVINNLVTIGLLLAEGYIIYANVDSIEALLFSRFLAKVPEDLVGSWELEQGRWSMKEMGRGRLAFLFLGLAMFLLSFVAPQVVTAVEALMASYVAVVLVASSILPLPAGASVIFAAVFYVLSGVGIAWLGKRTLNFIRGHSLRKGPREV